MTTPMRVLVADDDGGVADAACRVLEARGIEVVVARTGAQAVREFHSAPFDVVVLDMIMPDMNGREARSAIRALSTSVRIVIMSGHPRLEPESGSDPNTRYLRKPFSSRELLQVLLDGSGVDPADA